MKKAKKETQNEDLKKKKGASSEKEKRRLPAISQIRTFNEEAIVRQSREREKRGKLHHLKGKRRKFQGRAGASPKGHQKRMVRVFRDAQFRAKRRETL